MSEIENSSIITESANSTPAPIRSRPNKVKIKSYKTSKPGEPQIESSSSSDDGDDDEQKIQIRIRPKSLRNKSGSIPGVGGETKQIPLLPKPPKTVQEIDELRQRRMSSGAESMSKYGSNVSDSDEDLMKIERSDEVKPVKVELKKTLSSRKDSVMSEFNLELPDEDDFAPLEDFNEKCQLTR